MNYIVSDTKLIDAYIEQYRPDNKSEKPYYLKVLDNDGSTILPNDPLIVKSIKSTGTPYTLLLEIDGQTIHIDSDSLK